MTLPVGAKVIDLDVRDSTGVTVVGRVVRTFTDAHGNAMVAVINDDEPAGRWLVSARENRFELVPP